MTAERDLDAKPYSADEARVAKWFSDHGVGGGVDPIGAMISGLEYRNFQLTELKRDCSELYQVIGTMAESCVDPEAAPIIKALDNASAAANGYPRPHDDLLPFILEQSIRENK